MQRCIISLALLAALPAGCTRHAQPSVKQQNKGGADDAPAFAARETGERDRASSPAEMAQASLAQSKKTAPPGVKEKHAHGEKPDNPGEAMAFRYMQRLGEDGLIPPNALMTAEMDRRNALRGFQPNNGGINSLGWSEIGPGNVGGRIRVILIHPTTPTTMWLGSVGGGIWKTTDGGANWTTAGNFLPTLPVGCMVMDPTNPNVLYAGTGEGFNNSDSLPGAGILKSTDGGVNWTQIAATIPVNADPTTDNWGYVNRIAISPADNAVLLAATRTGLFRSINGGTSWTQVISGQPYYDVDFHPTDGTKAVAGSSGTQRGRFSTDGGATWGTATGITTGTAGTGGSRTETAYSVSNPNVVYAGVNAGNSTIFKSTDGGQTYTLQSTNTGYLSGQGWYDNILWVDPTDEHTIIVGGLDLWRSTNDGVNLNQISQWFSAPNSAHADHHAIIQHPAYDAVTNKTVFFGNDGGIYKANDVSTVSLTSGWTFLNHTLGITQFYGGAINKNSGVVIGGTQDNGTLRYNANPNGWTAMFGGDGGFCAADPTNSNYFYGEYVRCRIHRSANGGLSSGYIYTGGPNPMSDAVNSAANFISHFVLDPNNPNRILACCANLWRTNNAKATPVDWFIIKPSIGSNISTVAVASGNPDIIWAGHNNGDVYRTTNGTAVSPTWTKMDDNTPALPNRFVQRIAVDPADTNRVYVAFSGYSTQNLWRSDNGGANWTVVTGPGSPGQPGNLPRAPVNSVVLHPVLAGWIYAGTDVGVWASTDFGATWSTTNDGPASVDVEELFFNGQTKLIAATHGRGMFQAVIDTSALDCNTNSTPDASELAGQDCNANGILDLCENRDCNTNGTPDSCETDCNSNGVADACESAINPNLDCNTNATLDLCEAGADCNQNAMPDACDLAINPAIDCDTNQTIDTCEFASGDCDGNLTLDVCELAGADCNTNGFLDACDLSGVVAATDACAAAARIVPGVLYTGSTVAASADGSGGCTGAGPDVWYLYVPAASGSVTISLCGSQFDTVLTVHSACPGNTGNQLVCDDDFCGGGSGSQVTLAVVANTPYYIRISGSGGVSGAYEMFLTGPTGVTASDCNGDGTLDVCEAGAADCNTNGTADSCDIAGGASLDVSPADGVPDECEAYSIDWSTVDGGGAMALTAAGGLELSGTAGQHDAGTLGLPTDAYQIEGGFWPAFATAVACALPGDMNLDGGVRGDDIQGFADCLFGGGVNCVCADVNADAAVNSGDIAPFIALLLP